MRGRRLFGEPLEARALLAATPTVIDVLMLYTPGALAHYAGSFDTLQTGIRGSISSANMAMVTSRISVVFRIAGIQAVNYIGDGDLFVDRTRLSNPSDGILDEAHTLRNAFGADLVALVTESNGFGGNGDLPLSMAQLDSGAFAFSANNVGSVVPGNLTLAHELGHNLGAGHERGNPFPTPGIFPYSYGHRFNVAGNLYRDVMAVQFPAIEYMGYANPAVSFQGVPTGVPVGQPDSADIAATFAITAPAVSNFRASVLSDAEAPTASLYRTTLRPNRQLDVVVRWADPGGVAGNSIVDGGLRVTLPAAYGGYQLKAGLIDVETGGEGGAYLLATYRAILPANDPPVELLTFGTVAGAARDTFGNTSAAITTLAKNTTSLTNPDFANARDLGSLAGPMRIHDMLGFTGSAGDDTYRFAVSGPGTISVQLTDFPATQDLQIYIAKDNDGNGLITFPGDFLDFSYKVGGGVAESFAYNAPAAGTYFLSIFKVSPSPDVAPYTLSLRQYSDTTPPTATLDAADITAPTNKFRFTVEYTDNQEVDGELARFVAPVRITPPLGGFYLGFPVAIDTTFNGPRRIVTYEITLGFTFSAADNGVYTVAMEPQDSPIFSPPLNDYISDAAGNKLVPATIGSFRIAIGQPDTTRPIVVATSIPNVNVGGASFSEFTVTYFDNVAINETTIGDNDIRITFPGGGGTFATKVAVSETAAGGARRTVTYRFTPPGGSWDVSDRGTYLVALFPSTISDIAGNTALDTFLPSFQVTVPLPGDATGDNAVNIADFSVLASNFNRFPRGFDGGDFNYTGEVEIGDFAILASRFNTQTAPADQSPLPVLRERDRVRVEPETFANRLIDAILGDDV